MTIKILVSDKIADEGIELLEKKDMRLQGDGIFPNLTFPKSSVNTMSLLYAAQLKSKVNF